MNEMYDLSIGIHDFGVFVYIAMVAVNMVLLVTAQEIRIYAKRMRILMPVSASMIAVMIFTGAIMMAAKHLDFTVENIVMILFSVMLIVLEAKRYKRLKRTDPESVAAFGEYKRYALKLMGIVLGGSVFIAAWMLLA